MMILNYEQYREEARAKGYPWYSKAYDLNLMGIRNSNVQSGAFDDTLAVIYRDDARREVVVRWEFTADPSPHYLVRPINAKGTAILAPGHYPGMWRPGLHRGKYRALVQVGRCTVIRDANRDRVLDFDSAVRESGFFGINLHYGRGEAASAGCQVVREQRELNAILGLVDRQAAFIGSKRVSYTLFYLPELQTL